MTTLVEAKRAEIARLCAKHGVHRVEFEPQTPARRADSYFGLMEDLQKLFGLPVDLVEPGPITNPYFRQAVEKTQVVVHAVA
jgi:hypothetical protein